MVYIYQALCLCVNTFKVSRSLRGGTLQKYDRVKTSARQFAGMNGLYSRHKHQIRWNRIGTVYVNALAHALEHGCHCKGRTQGIPVGVKVSRKQKFITGYYSVRGPSELGGKGIRELFH